MMDSADSTDGGGLAEAEGGWKLEESWDAASSDSSAVPTSTTEDAAVAVVVGLVADGRPVPADDGGRWPALF